MEYATVDVLLANNPVKLIVALDPAQTVDDCDAPVNVGAGFTVIKTGVELVSAQTPL